MAGHDAGGRDLSDASQTLSCSADAGDAGTPAASRPVDGLSHGAGEAKIGRLALQRQSCRGCRVIPGVVGSQRFVGPPLGGFARRSHIAGMLPQTPENVVAWLRASQHIEPGSLMPLSALNMAGAKAVLSLDLALTTPGWAKSASSAVEFSRPERRPRSLRQATPSLNTATACTNCCAC